MLKTGTSALCCGLGLALAALAHATDVPFYHTLSTIGGARATAYPSANRIVTTGAGSTAKTHVAWVDYIGNLPGSDRANQNDGSRLLFRTFNRASRTWSPVQNLGAVIDDHGGATMAEENNGRMSIVYGAHNSALFFRQMPLGATTYLWGAPAVLADDSTYTGPGTERTDYAASYPSMVADASVPNMYHLVFRGGYQSTPGVEYFRREYSSAAGMQGWRWRRKHTLVYESLPGQYVEFGSSIAVSEAGTLHVAYHFQHGTRAPYFSEHIGYLKSTDRGATWRNAAGTVLTLPVLPDSGPAVVASLPGAEFRVSNIDVDAADHPWFAASDPRHSTFKVYHHDGAQWVLTDLTPLFQRLAANFHAVGDSQLAIRDDDGEIVIVATYLTGSQAWGESSDRIVLLRSPDGGKGWYVKKKISPDEDPAVGDWSGVIEHDTGGNAVNEPQIAYSHGNWSSVNAEVRFVDSTQVSRIDEFFWSPAAGAVEKR